MPPSRTQQHKPQRDAAKARELAALKQENKHLKRQIARLRKHIEKLQGMEVSEEYQEVVDEITQQEEAADSEKCPNCKNQLVTIKTPTTKIVGCTNCKWRQK